MPDDAVASPNKRDPLDLDRLAGAVGYAVEVVPEVGSTNALLAGRARDGAPHGVVVVTEHQTAGRGRLARTWVTPLRSALTFSLLLRPDVAAAQWPWLSPMTGVAVARVLCDLGVDASLKWPNDVLVGATPSDPGRKVAGLLAERVETPTGPAAVLGIGLNVSLTRAELPVETATSLSLEGVAPDRTDLLLALLSALAEEYDGWLTPAGRDRLRTTYSERCSTLGRQVRVELPGGGRLAGTATGVAASGALVVDGREVGAGDVVHVRPVQ